VQGTHFPIGRALGHALARHRGDVPLEVHPAVEAQFARDQELRLGELGRVRREARERGGIAGLRGLQQVPGAPALLLEIEAKLRHRHRRISGPSAKPSRSIA
jgi:hypothetical protein